MEGVSLSNRGKTEQIGDLLPGNPQTLVLNHDSGRVGDPNGVLTSVVLKGLRRTNVQPGSVV